MVMKNNVEQHEEKELLSQSLKYQDDDMWNFPGTLK
jgi:5-methylcytosine-specific restriction endonuclease McrBC GTP-binding regulatory subunit McrB